MYNFTITKYVFQSKHTIGGKATLRYRYKYIVIYQSVMFSAFQELFDVFLLLWCTLG